MHLFNWHTLYANLWTNLLEFGTGDPVSLAEKILRPVLVYLFLVVLLKWVGKRILAQLNPFDLVVLLTLSNTVQNAIIGNDTSLSGGLIGAAALIGVNAVLVRMHYRGAKQEHEMIEGDIYLIRDRETQEKELERLRINIGELSARAHERGFDALKEVQDAVLYPNGTIYMKGCGPTDAARYDAVTQELRLLREAVTALAARR